MKTNTIITALALFSLLLTAPHSRADSAYWSFNGTGNYSDTVNWAINADGSGGNPAAVPGSAETATFTSSDNNNLVTSSLTAGTTVGGLVFTNTANTTIDSFGTASVALTLQSGGLTLNSGAGNVTFESAAAGNRVTFVLAANQTWTNNSSNALALGAQNPIATGGFLLTVDGPGNITTSTGAISGTGGIVKNGTGNLTLAATNTFSTGGITLNNGTLRLGANAALGGAASILTINGGVIDATAARSTTNNNAQNWNGNFTYLGSNTWNTGTGAVTMNASRTVTVDDSTMTVGGVIGDGGNAYSLTKEGAGTLTFTANNTYSGGTWVNAGTLKANKALALPLYASPGNLSVAGGATLGLNFGNASADWTTAELDSLLANNAGAFAAGSTLAITSTTGNAAHSGNITGNMGVTLIDTFSAGTNTPSLILSGNNTFAGNVTISATCVLSVNRTEALGSGAEVVINQNANLLTTDNMTINQNINFLAGGANPTLAVAAGTTLSLNGSLGGGSGGPCKDNGTGMLILNGPGAFTNNATVFLLQTGGITIANAAAFNGTSLKFNGGVTLDNTSGSSTPTGLLGLLMTSGCNYLGTQDLDLSGVETGFVQTAGSTRNITVSAGTFTLNGITTTGNFAFAGTPKLDGGLGKLGAGTLAIAGASDYTLGTTVYNGTLRADNPSGSATGSGNVTVNTGGSLGGTGSISGNALVETDGGFAFGLSTAPGSHDRLDIGGALTFNGTTNLTITADGNATTGNYTLLNAAGGITGSAPANLSLPAGWNATASIAGNNLVLSVTSLSGGNATGFAAWAAGYGLNGSLTDNFDTDKFSDGEEYAFDLDPTVDEYGNVLASQTALLGGNVTLTLAFSGNSAKSDINYVVRRANNPAFTANTVVGFWNGTANWTTSNSTYFANQTQSGAGDVKAINVNLALPAASEPRQFLKVDIE